MDAMCLSFPVLSDFSHMTVVNTEPILYASDVTPPMLGDLWARERIGLQYERRKANCA